MIKQLSASSILIFALGLAGCDLSGKKAPPSGTGTTGASFEVLSIDGDMYTDKVDPVFLTPASRLFNMKACMIDNLYRKQIANQRFTVWDGQGKLIADRVSDDKGCLTWQERPNVNFFAKSEYIFQTRTLHGEGSARGEAKMPVAFNPWIHGEALDPVVDLTHEGVSSYNAVATSFVNEQKSFLWLEKLDLQNVHEISAQNGKLTLAARLQFPALFLTKDTQGRDVPVSISGGKYKAVFTLFVQNPDSGTQEPLSRLEIAEMTAEKGLINKDIQFTLAHIPTSGVYRIAFRLIPLGGPATLGEFQGTFDLGNVDTYLWASNTTAQLSSEVYGKSGTYSVANIESLQASTTNTSASEPAYFIDPKVTCMWDRIEVETETAIHRTIIYRTQFCVTRRDNKKVPKDTMIHVKKNSGEEVDLPTNKDGCVDFEDKISHNFFEPECRQISTAHLSNSELGLDADAPLQLNPWHGYGTFCRDARIVGPDEMAKIENAEQCKAARPKSELFIDAFDMNMQQADYQIDNNLDLITKKKFLLGINMRTARPSNQLDGRGLYEPLRKGLYLLRWVVLRNGYEAPDKAYNFIDGSEDVVQSSGGRIMHQIWVKIKDARTLDSRNRILLQVSTIDESKVEKVDENEWRPKAGLTVKDIEVEAGLPTVIYEGNFVPRDNGYILVVPYSLNHLDGTAKAQLDYFKGWTDRGLVTPNVSLFPDRFNGLADIITMGRELEKLHEQSLADIRNSYEAIQDLTEIKAGQSLTEKLPYESFVDVMNAKQPNSDFHYYMCDYWARTQIPAIMKEHGVENVDRFITEDNRRHCITSRGWDFADIGLFYWMGARKYPFLIYQNVLRAEEASVNGTLFEGRNYNIAVGEQFSMGSRFVNTTDVTFKLPVGKIPVVGQILELGFGLSNTSTFRSDHGTDMTFGTQSVLRSEETTLPITLKKYRRCMIVRMNPEITSRMAYFRLMIRKIEDEVARSQAQREMFQKGIEVCGPLITEPYNTKENYYFVQTQMPPGAQQDSADLRNRGYSVQLRGVRDMTAFMQLGRSQITNPDTMGNDPKSFEAWSANMAETFQVVTPASPGVILEDIYY